MKTLFVVSGRNKLFTLLLLAGCFAAITILFSTLIGITLNSSVSAAKKTGAELRAQAEKECQADPKGKEYFQICVSAYIGAYEGNPSVDSPLYCSVGSCLVGVELGKAAADKEGGPNEATMREVCKSAERTATQRAIMACRVGFLGAANGQTQNQACKDYTTDDRVDACKAGYDAQKNNITTASLKPLDAYSPEGALLGSEESDEKNDDCDAKFYNPLTWIVCPVVDGINTAVDQLDAAINDLLTVDTARIFDTSDKEGSGYAYMQAWNSFRVIGIAIIVISALVVIISSAFGFEILDAYTIRKTLPRLLIALVVITLSWNILYFLINLSNDVGNGVRWIIYQPFSRMEDLELGQGGLAISNLLLGGGIVALGIMGLLSFGVTALLAALIAFLVLILRELIIIFLVIIAPVGIACMILPNTRKVWDLWQKTLVSMLIAFPIIAAMIAVGRVFSTTVYANGQASALEEIIAYIAYLLPYFMLPFAFRLAGGLIATLGGLANDRSRGAFDRLKNYRGNKVQDNMHRLKEGNRVRSSNRAARMFNATTAGAANIPSAGMVPWKMKSRYQSGMSQHHKKAMAEYMDKSEAWKAIAGNDDYLQATMKSMGGGDTEEHWRNYLSSAAGGGYTGRALEQGVAAIRAAKRDTNDHVFKAAAVVANASTGTGWKTGGAGAMMDSINEAAGGDRDLAASMLAEMRGRAEKARRTDLSGAGFGGQMADLNAMYSSDYAKAEHGHALGKRLERGEATERNNNKALFLQNPGALIGARGDTIKLLAPQMVKRLQGAHKKLADAKTPADQALAQRELKQEYAMLAGRYDAMSHAAPENAKIMADNVFGVGVGGMSVQQRIEGLRGDSEFLEMRREYSSAATAAAADGSKPAAPPPEA